MTSVRVPKLLLLVNSPPGATGVGELFLRELARFYPADRLVRFSTVPEGQDSESVWLGFRSIVRVARTSSIPAVSTLLAWSFARRAVSPMSDEILRVIEDEGIDTVWFFPSGTPVIEIASQLQERSRVNWVTTMLDSPQYLTRNQRLDRITTARVIGNVRAVLARSYGLSVVTEAMAAAYAVPHGIPWVRIVHGIDRRQWLPDDHLYERQETFRIVFAGSLYAKREWNAFLKAIKQVGQTVDGRKIQLFFLGEFPRRGAQLASFVEVLGYRSFHETMRTLASADLAYLPYWFDTPHQEVARTSFPSKLSAYVAASVPIFFHGPDYASPANFLREYPVGVACHSLAPHDIAHCLQEAASLRASDSLLLNQRQALDRVLGLEPNLRAFATLLGIERSSLLSGVSA